MNWTEHKAKWKGCQRCALCKDRFSVCLLRGEIPAKILFIGEGPGPSEDGSAPKRHGLGKPFVGPAGEILQTLIDVTVGDRYSYALTNLVGCMPMDDEKKKYVDPPDWAIEACAPRLDEVIAMVRPKLIFRVGTLAKNNINRNRCPDAKFADITHPGAILKLNAVMRAIPLQRIEADILAALGDWLND